MWEITLLGKPSDIVYFLESKNTTKKIFGSSARVVITFEKDLVLSLAVLDKNHIKRAKKLVMQTIIKIVKIEYMQQNLKIFSSDKSLNSFLLSNIITLDLSDEVNYALQKTKLTKIVSIRSFVQFRLHNVIELWDREIGYYNLNFGGDDESKYLSLLKFIANNNTCKSDIMYLEIAKNEMLLLDNKRKKLKSINLYDEVGIIASLVMFAPRRLIINCTNSLANKVSNLISYIFEDRVSVLL